MIEVDGVKYPRSVFWNSSNRKNSPGPGKKGLQKGIIAWLEKNNPDLLLTDFELAMKEIGVKVLYNLHMHPEFNPIELAPAGLWIHQ